MRRLLVVVGLLFSLLYPVSAMASPLDSFTYGLNDTLNPDVQNSDETVTYERDFIDSYEPVQAPVQYREVEEGDTQGFIESVVQAWQTVPWYNTTATPVLFLRYLFTNGVASQWFLLIPAGLVFFWWGVRKAVQMIMTAWRSGKQNV